MLACGTQLTTSLKQLSTNWELRALAASQNRDPVPSQGKKDQAAKIQMGFGTGEIT